MKPLNSIQVRLPLLIFSGFVLTILLVIAIVEHNMATVITDSQTMTYSEQLKTIIRVIDNNYGRLLRTGMVDVYEEDFQLSTIRMLRHSYPLNNESGVTVFILTEKGSLLLPDSGSFLSFSPHQLAQKLVLNEKGSLDLFSPGGGHFKCYFQSFSPWQWKVGYLVSEAVSNRVFQQLVRTLVIACGCIAFIVVCLLLLVIRQQLQPIHQLTEASEAMAKGNLEHSIYVDRQDEIGALANHFNHMQAAIKTTIESLLRNEKNLNTVLNSIGDAVIVTDVKRNIVRFNPVAETLTGWSSREAIGLPLEQVLVLIDPETRQPLTDNLIELNSNPVNLQHDFLVISRDMQERLIADSVAPLRYDDDDISGVVWVFRDVTEERALQEQLFQTRKMETIGQLAGGVAHDFNNMIGGVLGAAELLKMNSSSEKDQKYIDMIINAGERAAGLTAKLLAFARKKALRSTPVDADLAIRSAIDLLERTIDPRIHITKQLATTSSQVIGDFSQLENVFLNLLINASQAMQDGGELIISSSVLELEEAYCRQSSFPLIPGRFLDVMIKDTGCGISPENIQRIFEPFFTTKPQGSGTGLGLSEVLGTVQAHQGEITVSSKPGEGTVFHVFLPLSDLTAASKTPAPKILPGTGKILVIDDEGVMRVTATAILSELGYQVLAAENGQVGLDMFRDKHKEIDLVLLDMVMPEMNGRDCFFAMRQIDTDVRVIVSSGFAQSEELADMRDNQLLGFVRKPYRAAVLSRVVAAALAGDVDNPILWDS